MKRKRMVINIMGVLAILIGGMGLTTSGTASTALPFDRCTAGTGAVCEGEKCCANETMCSTDPGECAETE